MPKITKFNFDKDKKYIFLSHQTYFKNQRGGYDSAGYIELVKCKFDKQTNFYGKGHSFNGYHRHSKNIRNISSEYDFVSDNAIALVVYESLDYIICESLDDYISEIKNFMASSLEKYKNSTKFSITTDFTYLIIEDKDDYFEVILNKVNDLLGMIEIMK